jgi:hypothetical protein
MVPRCQHCGAEIRSRKRSGRKAAFCSYKCRDAARRNRNFVGSGNTRKGTQAIPRNASKSSTNSSHCKGDFADRGRARSVPLNLLGGYRWPGAEPLDADTREKIYWAEIGEPPGQRQRVVKKRQTPKHVIGDARAEGAVKRSKRRSRHDPRRHQPAEPCSAVKQTQIASDSGRVSSRRVRRSWER